MDMMLMAMESMFQRIEGNQASRQQQFGEQLMERFDKRQHYLDDMMHKGFRDLGNAISGLVSSKSNQEVEDNVMDSAQHEVRHERMLSMHEVNHGRQMMSHSSHVDKGKRPMGDASHEKPNANVPKASSFMQDARRGYE